MPARIPDAHIYDGYHHPFPSFYEEKCAWCNDGFILKECGCLFHKNGGEAVKVSKKCGKCGEYVSGYDRICHNIPEEIIIEVAERASKIHDNEIPHGCPICWDGARPTHHPDDPFGWGPCHYCNNDSESLYEDQRLYWCLSQSRYDIEENDILYPIKMLLEPYRKEYAS